VKFDDGDWRFFVVMAGLAPWLSGGILRLAQGHFRRHGRHEATPVRFD
jgi:hypothetical protein